MSKEEDKKKKKGKKKETAAEKTRRLAYRYLNMFRPKTKEAVEKRHKRYLKDVKEIERLDPGKKKKVSMVNR